MLTALKQVRRVVLLSIGRSSSRQRKALNQNAKNPNSIERMTNPQRQALRPSRKSAQPTPRKEKYRSAAASAMEPPYLRIFPTFLFMVTNLIK